MTTLPLTALITLMAIALMFWTAIGVGRARVKYEVKAPATSGNDMFDRAYRVQMNTMESALMLLPALWVYAAFNGDTGAAVMGLTWVVGRIWYALAYQKDPAKRGGGFSLALLAIAGLWAGGLWGVVKVLSA
ncbi:MAG: MAPEG family protein [Betaproteobacteria bacterium]|nr:MAPEG family protein [Betaproteobacteria bacterium]